MEKARDEARQHPGREGRQHGQPGVDAAPDQHDADGAAGGEGAIHGEVRHIQDAEGEVDADGHQAPDQALPHGAGQGVQQSGEEIHNERPSFSVSSGGSCQRRTRALVRRWRDPRETRFQGEGQCPSPAGNGSAFDGRVVLGNGDVQGLAVGGVVHLGDVGGGLHGHGGDVSLALEDLHGHLTGDGAQLIVVDGEGGDAAAGADALLTRNHGDTGGQDHVGDGLGVLSGLVVGGDVDDIGGVAGGLGHGGDVVAVGEGEGSAGVAHVGEALGHLIHLILAVGLGGAVQQAHGLGVGEELLQHGGLAVQGSEVGGAGDIAAGGAGPAVHLQGGGVVGDGGAQDGDVAGGGGGGGFR